MRKLLWIAGVCVAVLLVYISVDGRGYLWKPLIGALIVVGIFFAGLIVYIVRHSKSVADSITGVSVLVVLSGLLAFSGSFFYNYAQWQHDLLIKDIRTTIQKGIMLSHIQEPLLKTLNAYHRHPSASHEDLNSLFIKRYRSQLDTGEAALRFIPSGQDEEHRDSSPLIYFDSTATEHKVALVGQSLYGQGKKDSFVNYVEGEGSLQYRGVLTKEGVRYVREN